MAFLRIGSKSDAFHRQGKIWQCTTGLPSDITIEIGDVSFQLHKFPLLSRSGLLAKRINGEDDSNQPITVLQLTDVPGGAKAFEFVARFCYGVKIELNALNVVSVRCAADYLQMNEEFGEGNLVAKTESFLSEIFANWTDSMNALESCQEVLPYAEKIQIVSRCINSLSIKACADSSLLSWPVSVPDSNEKTRTTSNETGTVLWNGISVPSGDDWWYDDVSVLRLPLYKQLIRTVEIGGMKPERISGSIMYYSIRHLQIINNLSNSTKDSLSHPPEAEQRALLEEIVELLPVQKGATDSRFLLKLLRVAMILQASLPCRENLEKKVGFQLDMATLEDLLIPNMGYSGETLYDVECFQRILDHFMSTDLAISASPCIFEEDQVIDGAPPLMSLTMVANLVDAYLADVAPDVNLKFPKFLALAGAIPDYARPVADAIYRAIDIYLKAHSWLTDLEREQVCRLMNCQKLSLEASTHAAQNERLPLRVIVQVLFFEQLRLRTSISGWFFVSEGLENPQSLNLPLGSQERVGSIDDVRERVSELEKHCESMKEEIQKLVKTKKPWSIFWRRKSTCKQPPNNETTTHLPAAVEGKTTTITTKK
ncbi:BTB/POZ domain-containing protein At5g03250 [Impatiens glandulifera]|uniref:BTB/POZ domain-containing protein At5g03250 n=1 Tax=Impatiens glandulifera TaxID=253017 RepID=UPI001FB19CC0|nr:BTB/POZ domain-containing protein At5g03250 [Impatiens glandulifera]XP_047337618.1 BTB/POZ domain-containing protein At5g03250 [Impatiens glandulifera]